MLDCDNLVESRNICPHHVRRTISGNVYYEPDPAALVDHCNEGHPLAGDNVRWESSGRNGRRRRRCRTCLRLRAQAKANETSFEVRIPEPYRPDDLSLSKAIDDFEAAKALVDGKCKGNPGPWMDWDDDDDNAVPTQEEAEAMCAGCALVKACPNYAWAARETHGNWGGHVIRKGVWLTLGVTRLQEES